MSGSTTIPVGGREYALSPFGARRAFAAMRMIAAINSKVGDLQVKMAVFAREYAKANALTITRHHAWMANLPDSVRAMSAEDWDRCGGHIELPQSPSTMQVYGAVLPEVIGAAEDDVLRLVALAVVSNDDYGNAVVSGGVDSLLDAKREELLANATLEELVGLIDAVVEHARAQIKGLADKVPNLRRLLPGAETEAEDEETPAPTETTATDGTKPDSSTSSPEPTDGAPSEPSTESPISTS